MRYFDGHFDEIFPLEATVRQPSLNENDLVVEVCDLPILEGHPLFEELPYKIFQKNIRTISSGALIFKNCIFSKRIIVRYIGGLSNPEGYEKPETIIDVPRREPPPGSAPQEFFFQSFSTLPPTFIRDWTIIALGFSLRVDG